MSAVPDVPPLVPSEQAAAQADRVSSRADEASACADVLATDRDDAAADREKLSEARDREATARDRAAEQREFTDGPGGPAYAAALVQAAEVRARAAADRGLAADDRRRATLDRRQAEADRERAASDRRHAAMDRDHAAIDRRAARAELERAHTDDLTGAYRRGAGQAALEHELGRARRTGEGLVMAYVDVDGLKATNDRDGHAAGDARLKDVVAVMRSKLRSYEPIVRYGGDEFVCSVAGVDLAAVQVRFQEIGVVLGSSAHPGSLSVGLAEMRPDDTLDDLVRRADDALVVARGSPGRSAPD
jgi:diguanylate cyclase (GGDEF)-like protein